MGWWKKITRGVKNIFKGAAKVVKKVTTAVTKTVKRVWKSKLGKALILAAAIYTGGAAIGLLATPSQLMAGASLMATPAAGSVAASIANSPVVLGALKGASLGAVTGAATGGDKGAIQGAMLGAAAGGALGYMSGPAQAAAPAAETASAGGIPNVPGTTPMSGFPEYGGGIGDAAQAAVAPAPSGLLDTATSWAKENPMLATGMMQTGGKMISGYAKGKAEEEKARVAAQAEQDKFNRSQIGASAPGIQATFNGNPMDDAFWQSIQMQNVANNAAPMPSNLVDTPIGQPQPLLG